MHRLVSVFPPGVALLWHTAARMQEVSPVQEPDMLPKFQMCVMTWLTDEAIKQGTESLYRSSYRGVALATSVEVSHECLLWSAFIPPSRDMRSGITLGSLFRQRTEEGNTIQGLVPSESSSGNVPLT